MDVGPYAPHRNFSHAHFYGRSPLAAIYIRVARQRDSARDGELPLQTRGLLQHEMEFSKIVSVLNTGDIMTFIKLVPLHNSYCIGPTRLLRIIHHGFV